MPPRTYFYQLWVKLSGHPDRFPLNARIYHSVSVISIFALGYNVPFNYLIGLPKVALASFIVLLASFTLYYLSRFKGLVAVCIRITNIMGLMLFTFNYFLNSGLGGPTDLFFLLFLLLSISISPSNEYKFWIPVNVGIFVLLGIFELHSPDVVPNTYTDRPSRFIDHLSAYAVVAAITYFCADYIRRSYEQEKQSALEKSQAIEQKNEQILIQNRALEKLDAEKNKLMSIVAHDLRSPLGSIQNFLELLTQHELDNEQKLQIENELLNATKNTLAMLSKVLDWSKSQLHGVSARARDYGIKELFEPTLNLERNIAARKNISLDYDLDEQISIFADGDMMQIILRNIIGNAIKFTNAGGSISVRAEVKGGDCIITVQDSGIGISAEKVDSIFSLQVQSTYGTKNEKGVGLGLLLCMDFIQAQNGKIWFESKAGEGTCFYISIPVSEKAVPQQLVFSAPVNA